MTRRDLLRRSAVTTLASIALEAQESAPAPTSPQLKWLGNAAPPLETGVSWGVPWPRGAVSKSQTFSADCGRRRAAAAIVAARLLARWLHQVDRLRHRRARRRRIPPRAGIARRARFADQAYGIGRRHRDRHGPDSSAHSQARRGVHRIHHDGWSRGRRAGAPGLHARRRRDIHQQHPQGHGGTARAGSRHGEDRRRPQIRFGHARMAAVHGAALLLRGPRKHPR